MKSENKLIGAGLLTAITASLCCITPVLALIAGTSGIVSTFSGVFLYQRIEAQKHHHKLYFEFDFQVSNCDCAKDAWNARTLKRWPRAPK